MHLLMWMNSLGWKRLALEKGGDHRLMALKTNLKQLMTSLVKGLEREHLLKVVLSNVAPHGDSERSPNKPYRMRLSDFGNMDKMSEPTPTESNAAKLDDQATSVESEVKSEEIVKRVRKASDILLGDSLEMGGREPVINMYSHDLIMKRYSSLLKKRRESITKRSVSRSTVESDYNKEGYYIKTRSSPNNFVPFVSNPVQKRFYELFDSEAHSTSVASDHVSNPNKMITLQDIHVDPKMALIIKKQKRTRNPKREDHNSKDIPKDFFSGLSIQPASPFFSRKPNSVRKSPLRGKLKEYQLTISPLLPKKSTDSLSVEEREDSGQMKDKVSPIETDENKLGLSGSLSSMDNSPLKRQLSAELFNKKALIQAGRISVGTHSKPELNESFEFEERLKRVNSVSVKKNEISQFNFAMPNLKEVKKVSKFKILEQKLKNDLTLSILIIFNETTTLKVRLAPTNSTLGSQNSFNDSPEPERKSSIISISGTAADEKPCFEAGRYKILRTKSLMFAKDPIKNELFEFSLKYVENNFWYDTLYRFLEIVDRVYTDLTHYYSRVLKELSANNTAASIENNNTLLVDGHIKSAKITCKTVLQSSKFTVEPRENNGAAYLPFSPVRKLLTSRPHEALNTSTADALVAFRYFVSSYA